MDNKIVINDCGWQITKFSKFHENTEFINGDNKLEKRIYRICENKHAVCMMCVKE